MHTYVNRWGTASTFCALHAHEFLISRTFKRGPYMTVWPKVRPPSLWHWLSDQFLTCILWCYTYQQTKFIGVVWWYDMWIKPTFCLSKYHVLSGTNSKYHTTPKHEEQRGPSGKVCHHWIAFLVSKLACFILLEGFLCISRLMNGCHEQVFTSPASRTTADC